MIRREFLKRSAATSAAIAVSGGLAFASSPKKTHFFCQPQDLFERIQIDPGVIPEFPIELVGAGVKSPRRFFISKNGAVFALPDLGGFVYVPYLDVGASGRSHAETRQNFEKKLEKRTGDLLKAAGGLPVRGKSTNEVVELISKQLGDPPLAMTKVDDLIIGVDWRHSNKLVMPFRCDFASFDDWTQPGHSYGFAEVGFAILDERYVACGKVSERP